MGSPSTTHRALFPLLGSVNCSPPEPENRLGAGRISSPSPSFTKIAAKIPRRTTRRIVERRGIRNRCGRRYGGTHVIAIAPRLRCGSLRFNGKYKVKFHPQIKANLLIFEKYYFSIIEYESDTQQATGNACL